MSRKKIIIVHPGTQHAYRLANALAENPNIYQVKLYTWFLLSEGHFLTRYNFFKKRVKKINRNVLVYNFPLFELLLIIHHQLKKILKREANHNPNYYWQTIFGYFLLPILFFQRNKITLVTFETCGWPITKYAYKWNIPTVMDFPSISHEEALKREIPETAYGIKIKSFERQYIDYAISCSNFAKDSYIGLTSAKEHFVTFLGADLSSNFQIKKNKSDNNLHVCCLANTEKRKGLDILIKSFSKLQHTNKKLFLIGKISKKWFFSYCEEHKIEVENIILTGPIPQQNLADFLLKQEIDLHILASRFDSFGMVVPETMSLGIANVLSPFVGAGEMLENTVDGFIMKSLDTVSLSLCIQNYLRLSTQEKNTLIQKVLKKSNRMTWDNYNKRIRLIFNKILTSNK